MLIQLPLKDSSIYAIDAELVEYIRPFYIHGELRYFVSIKNDMKKIEIDREQAEQLARVLTSQNRYITIQSQNQKQFSTEPDYYKTPSPMGLPYFKILGIDPDGNGKDCRSFIRYLETSRDWDFYLCSAVKYLWRLGCKGTNLDITKDLKKAKQYLEWELAEPWRLGKGELFRIENCIKAIEQELQ